MMNNRGFTLIELLIVVMIIGIVSLALGTSLQGSIGSNRIETQVKEFQADLMHTRARAVQRNRIHFVQIGAGTYSIAEDTNDSGIFEAGQDTMLFPAPKIFEDQVTWAGGTIQVSTRGILAFGGAVPGTIQFTSAWVLGSQPDYDCIVLSETMVNIGRLNGGACGTR